MEMPGFCCTLKRCRVPKKDWVTLPPCNECEKAMDVAAQVMADQAMETEQRFASLAECMRETVKEGDLYRAICKVLIDKALSGDLKAIQLMMDILGERMGMDGLDALKIVLAPEVEELAK